MNKPGKNQEKTREHVTFFQVRYSQEAASVALEAVQLSARGSIKPPGAETAPLQPPEHPPTGRCFRWWFLRRRKSFQKAPVVGGSRYLWSYIDGPI